MRNGFIVTITGVALAAFIGVMGCSSKVRKADVATGDYYSEDEWSELSARSKNSYCAELSDRLSTSQADFEAKSQELQQTRNTISATRRQIVPLETEVRRLDSDIRSLTNQIATVRSRPRVWKIRSGDTLTSIAMMDEIYNDIDKWEYIFRANLDKIDDPYYVFPDTVLVIPRDFPTE